MWTDHTAAQHWPWASTATGNSKGCSLCPWLWRARAMLLLNSCHLWQPNYEFSVDVWISVLCPWQKGCLGKMSNKQLWQTPGIQVLAGISKEAAVTNRGPQRRTRPLRNRCPSPRHPGLGAGPGTHTWLRTWLPLQEHKGTQTSSNIPKQQARNPAPSDHRESEYPFSRTTTENIIQQARSCVRSKSGFRDPAWCFISWMAKVYLWTILSVVTYCRNPCSISSIRFLREESNCNLHTRHDITAFQW